MIRGLLDLEREVNMNNKCKWEDGKLEHCKGWDHVKHSKACRYLEIEYQEDFKTYSQKIEYCFSCGEPLKEPIPERVSIYSETNLYEYRNSIKSAHDRIDYILERLDK